MENKVNQTMEAYQHENELNAKTLPFQASNWAATHPGLVNDMDGTIPVYSPDGSLISNIKTSVKDTTIPLPTISSPSKQLPNIPLPNLNAQQVNKGHVNGKVSAEEMRARSKMTAMDSNLNMNRKPNPPASGKKKNMIGFILLVIAGVIVIGVLVTVILVSSSSSSSSSKKEKSSIVEGQGEAQGKEGFEVSRGAGGISRPGRISSEFSDFSETQTRFEPSMMATAPPSASGYYF
jgi:hypothetical protein